MKEDTKTIEQSQHTADLLLELRLPVVPELAAPNAWAHGMVKMVMERYPESRLRYRLLESVMDTYRAMCRCEALASVKSAAKPADAAAE